MDSQAAAELVVAGDLPAATACWRHAALALVMTALALPSMGCRDRRPTDHSHPAAAATKSAGRPRAATPDRPLHLRLPPDRSPRQRFPLLLALHGYGGSGPMLAASMGYDRLVRQRSFILAAPSGTVDALGNRFWRAGSVCCDHFGIGVDDRGYLWTLLGRLAGRQPVASDRVYLAGHSNGAHMVYRLLCRPANAQAPPIAAAVAIAGALLETNDCQPTGQTSLLHLQGDADGIVPYTAASRSRPGGRTVRYPGAIASVTGYARRVGCTGQLRPHSPLRRAGSAVRRQRVSSCPAGVDVELWTVPGAGHLSPTFVALADEIWRWLTTRTHK